MYVQWDGENAIESTHIRNGQVSCLLHHWKLDLKRNHSYIFVMYFNIPFQLTPGRCLENLLAENLELGHIWILGQVICDRRWCSARVSDSHARDPFFVYLQQKHMSGSFRVWQGHLFKTWKYLFMHTGEITNKMIAYIYMMRQYITFHGLSI